jgi:hypothetical protein
MQLDPDVAAAMYNRNPSVMKRLIEQFVELAIAQSWAFSYTDKIGNQCRRLFHAVPDYEIRAMLVDCVMQVGVSHNRWHVLRIFARLLENPKENGEEIALIERLQQADERTRQHAAEYLSIGKLHPAIRPLFEFNDNNE